MQVEVYSVNRDFIHILIFDSFGEIISEKPHLHSYYSTSVQELLVINDNSSCAG